MPVRKPAPTGRSVSGLHPTRKRESGIARVAWYETTLERDLFTCLEFDPAVLTYEEQPVEIPLADPAARRGPPRPYVPDVLVRFRDAPARLPDLLVEVKHRGELTRDPVGARRWARAAAGYARERGWQFRVLTEREIRTPYWHNAAFLLPFRLQRRDAAVEQALLAVLQGLVRGEERLPSARSLLESARDGGIDPVRALPSLWALVADFAVGVDLERPLDLEARLGPARSGTAPACWYPGSRIDPPAVGRRGRTGAAPRRRPFA